VEILETPFPQAQPVIRDYYADIIARYWGRPATVAEIDQTMVAEPSDDLRLYVAREGSSVLGCIALRLTTPPFAEVKRVYVVPAARGRGVAKAMMEAVEQVALARGLMTMRLDVRSDLVEARALYKRCGYSEVEPFNDDAYVGHWMAKDLTRV
jgi:ribosomal protein S18 acetylase RimI-like enzyme